MNSSLKENTITLHPEKVNNKIKYYGTYNSFNIYVDLVAYEDDDQWICEAFKDSNEICNTVGESLERAVNNCIKCVKSQDNIIDREVNESNKNKVVANLVTGAIVESTDKKYLIQCVIDNEDSAFVGTFNDEQDAKDYILKNYRNITGPIEVSPFTKEDEDEYEFELDSGIIQTINATDLNESIDDKTYEDEKGYMVPSSSMENNYVVYNKDDVKIANITAESDEEAINKYKFKKFDLEEKKTNLNEEDNNEDQPSEDKSDDNSEKEFEKVLDELRNINTYTEFVKTLKNLNSDQKKLFAKYFGDAKAIKPNKSEKSINCMSLLPTQSEIDYKKSLDYALKNGCSVFFKSPVTLGFPVLTYNGKYIIDGHHRWSQVCMFNPKADCAVIDFAYSQDKVNDVLRDFQAAVVAETGDVQVGKAGTNIWDVSENDLRSYIEENITDKCVEDLKNAKVATDKKSAIDYIVKNAMTFKEKIKPLSGAPDRVDMPQTNPDVINLAAKGISDMSEDLEKDIEYTEMSDEESDNKDKINDKVNDMVKEFTKGLEDSDDELQLVTDEIEKTEEQIKILNKYISIIKSMNYYYKNEESEDSLEESTNTKLNERVSKDEIINYLKSNSEIYNDDFGIQSVYFSNSLVPNNVLKYLNDNNYDLEVDSENTGWFNLVDLDEINTIMNNTNFKYKVGDRLVVSDPTDPRIVDVVEVEKQFVDEEPSYIIKYKFTDSDESISVTEEELMYDYGAEPYAGLDLEITDINYDESDPEYISVYVHDKTLDQGCWLDVKLDKENPKYVDSWDFNQYIFWDNNINDQNAKKFQNELLEYDTDSQIIDLIEDYLSDFNF